MLLEIDDEVFEDIISNWMMKEFEFYYSQTQLPHFDPEENIDDKYVNDCVVGFKLIMKTYLTSSEYEAFFERFEDAS